MGGKAIRRCLLAVTVAVGLFGAGASWWVGSQLLRPVPHRLDVPPDFPVTALSIPGRDRNVAAWWGELGSDAAAVVLAHSIRGDRSTMVPRARLLLRHGFSVLLIDLQAHGETPGTAITLGWKESEDVRAALAWLRRTRPSIRVGVIGCSLGGAAVLLGPQPSGFDAVVLETVYPRIEKAVENRIRMRLGPLAPLLTPLLLVQLRPRLGISPSELRPIEHIAELGSPVLLLAGSADEHTTLAESRELYDAAVEPKELWVVEGARHEDVFKVDPAGYETHVLGFLDRYLR